MAQPRGRMHRLSKRATIGTDTHLLLVAGNHRELTTDTILYVHDQLRVLLWRPNKSLIVR